jgi:hypothetical protein
MNSSRPTRELIVAVGDSAPFGVRLASEQAEVVAGQKVELKVQLDRHWPDFKGAVTLNGLAFPGPIKMNQVTIPEGKNEAIITLEVQSGARPGDYTLALQCHPGRVRKDGKVKSNTLVSTIPAGSSNRRDG